MHPNFLALLRAAALARAANPMAAPNPMAPQALPGVRPHPLALSAPRIGAPMTVAPPIMGNGVHVLHGSSPGGGARHSARARLPHPHALPMAMHPQHALGLPRGARFRVPGGLVKVRP